jgi:hypothetical protein
MVLVRVEPRRSKTDQEAEGRPVGIPYGSVPGTCPIRVVERWLGRLRTVLPGYDHGPLLLRLDAGGWAAVRIAAWRASCSAGQGGPDSILSASLATACAPAWQFPRPQAACPNAQIMNQTGHPSPSMVSRYIGDGELFRDDNAARGPGCERR